MLSRMPVHGLSHIIYWKKDLRIRKIEIMAIMCSLHVSCWWVKLSLEFFHGQGYLGFATSVLFLGFTTSVHCVAGKYLY